jgi:negative regulator of replication initiation
MVLVSAIGGLLISIFYVLAKKSFDTAQESLQERTRWHQLKASWSIGFKRKNAK